MGALWGDLRYGWRVLRRRPGFTAVAVLTLALGIGANAAIFSVVNAVLLRPLPYAEPGRLVAVFEREVQRGLGRNPTSPANFLDWQRRNRVTAAMAAATPWTPVHPGGDNPAQLKGLRASGELFPSLGVEPLLGRTFTPADDAPGRHRVVVLGHDLWQRRFGGDPQILGRKILLDGEPYEIIGVMPPGFHFPPFWFREAEMWAPFGFADQVWERRGRRFLRAFGRLKPGVSLEQAQAEFDAVAAALREEHPQDNAETAINVEPLAEPAVGHVRPALLVLLGAVGFVLLIACANVASLLLARAVRRRGELAIRMALGAGRAALLRQMLAEGLLLATLGAAAGLLLAGGAIQALAVLGPADLPRLEEARLDATVVSFTLLLTLVTVLLFALAPAWHALRDGVREAMNQGARGSLSRRSRRLHNALVVGEVALAMMLLAGAGLLGKSFLNLVTMDPGFDRQRLLTATVALTGTRHATPERQQPFFDALLERVGAASGVERAALINHLPIGGDIWGIHFLVRGRPDPPAGQEPRASFRVVSAEAFGALGIRVLRGRGFLPSDTETSPPVVIINRTLARQFFGDRDPIGARLKLGRDADLPWLEIVGVVEDVRQWELTQEVGPELYLPYPQNPHRWWQYTTLVVRTAGDPQAVTAAVREAVREVDAGVPLVGVRTMEQILDRAVGEPRFFAFLVSLFAGLALTLAAVGLYGVQSYAVTQRTREIGVRMALGARPADVLGMFVRQGAALAALGLAAGLGGALALTRWMESLLFGVTPGDPVIYLGVSLLLLAVALAACAVPAWRAMRTDPAIALRHE